MQRATTRWALCGDVGLVPRGVGFLVRKACLCLFSCERELTDVRVWEGERFKKERDSCEFDLCATTPADTGTERDAVARKREEKKKKKNGRSVDPHTPALVDRSTFLTLVLKMYATFRRTIAILNEIRDRRELTHENKQTNHKKTESIEREKNK